MTTKAREDPPAEPIGGRGQARVLGAQDRTPEAKILEHVAHLHGHVVTGARELLHAAP